jgi:hypothetical protein
MLMRRFEHNKSLQIRPKLIVGGVGCQKEKIKGQSCSSGVDTYHHGKRNRWLIDPIKIIKTCF